MVKCSNYMPYDKTQRCILEKLHKMPTQSPSYKKEYFTSCQIFSFE